MKHILDPFSCSDYAPYFAEIPIEAMADQTLFWSKTQPLVEVVSMMNTMGVNVISSTNVPASEIINNQGAISWCGMVNGELP